MTNSFDDDVQHLTQHDIRRVVRHATGAPDGMVDLAMGWPDVVGSELGSKTLPVRCIGHTLVVEAVSTAAAAGLRLINNRVVDACRTTFDLMIDRVQVRVMVKEPSGER